MQRIDDHIHDRLSDPQLSPRSIAAAHHISIGYLHRLFSQRGSSVATRIRQLRSERARQDLQDRTQDQVPIHRVANHWGFVDHSTFTRAFRRESASPRKRYGATGRQAAIRSEALKTSRGKQTEERAAPLT